MDQFEDAPRLDILQLFRTAYSNEDDAEVMHRYLEWEQCSKHPVLYKHADALLPKDAIPRPAFRELPDGSIYELTLTVPSVDDLKELIDGFYKIITSKMYEIHYYEGCIELTKAGVPHIHAMLVCGNKTPKASTIKKLYKYRFTCQKARMPDAFREYVWKGWGDFLIKNFCEDYNIRQFFRTNRHIYCYEWDR